jgi:hypothetical protein
MNGRFVLKLRVVLVLCLLCVAEMADTSSARAQVDQFDGVYAGTQTLTENSSVINYSQCLKGPFKRRLVVKGGTISYVFNPTYQGEVRGTITPAGDVDGDASEGGGVDLSGKIQGDTFTGEIWSLYCTYSVQLKRVQ